MIIEPLTTGVAAAAVFMIAFMKGAFGGGFASSAFHCWRL
jgi:hypothetical protein